jgi:catechol 2,3-dioxygenase-like lactoylglutathione lyase family enzyme
VKPARRFLHICYCCADGISVSQFFVDNFGMKATMSTPAEPSAGEILGLLGEVVTPATFVFDARGPRTSPAVEVQQWIDPPIVGTPVDDPIRAGIQALGLGVADLGASTARMVALGGTIVGSGTSAFGTEWTTLRDPRGITLDLVEDVRLPATEARMRHLRITCTNLDASRRWYEGIGFEVVDKATISDASFLDRGLTSVECEALRLRLPDEPFEAVLVEWRTPRSHGRHVEQANHAGLYRAALGVDDTRSAYEAMTAAGWVFDRAPMTIELSGTPVPDMWICFVSDPDGVPFEFVGRPRSAFR